jgi:peroxiredoxin
MNVKTHIIYNKVIPIFILQLVVVLAHGQSAVPGWITELTNPVQAGRTISDDSWLINAHRDTITFNELKGKWIIVDYWMTGCRPCIQEFPALESHYETIDTTKIEIIRVSIDRSFEQWQKSAKKYKTIVPDFYSGKDKYNHFWAINFVIVDQDDGSKKIITQTPQYVLLSPEGKIIDKELPKPSDASFLKIINSYIGQ